MLDESLLEGIKQHSLQSLFSHFVFQTEQSFYLQQLLMAARNNYGTGHWNRKEANSLPVFSMFFLFYTQLRKIITWVGRHSAYKKDDWKVYGKTWQEKSRRGKLLGKVWKILISTTNSNLVLLSTTTSHKTWNRTHSSQFLRFLCCRRPVGKVTAELHDSSPHCGQPTKEMTA